MDVINIDLYVDGEGAVAHIIIRYNSIEVIYQCMDIEALSMIKVNTVFRVNLDGMKYALHIQEDGLIYEAKNCYHGQIAKIKFPRCVKDIFLDKFHSPKFIRHLCNVDTSNTVKNINKCKILLRLRLPSTIIDDLLVLSATS